MEGTVSDNQILPDTKRQRRQDDADDGINLPSNPDGTDSMKGLPGGTDADVDKENISKQEYCYSHLPKTKGNVICVCVRGSITNKIFDIWSRQLRTLDRSAVVTSAFNPSATCMVVPIDPFPAIKTFEQWSNLNLQDLTPSDTAVSKTKLPLCVGSEWIINSIKYRKLLPFDSYIIEHAAEKIAAPMSKDATAAHLPAAADSLVAPEGHHKPEQRSSNYRKRRRSSTSSAEDTNEDTGSASSDTEGGSYRYPEVVKFSRDGNSKLNSSSDGAVTNSPGNPNKHITDIFDQLYEMYALTGEDYRASVYRRASGMLASMPHITEIEQVDHVRGIGKSLRDKIEEILETGTLQKLISFKNNPAVQARVELCKVWGIGDKTADMLIKKHKLFSVHDVRMHGRHLLTPQQLIGLDLYEELLTRIPRAEVARIEHRVDDYVQR
jgi:hypothetical protein